MLAKLSSSFHKTQEEKYEGSENVKRYREIAETIEKRISEAIKIPGKVKVYNFFDAVDSWLIFIEKDNEMTTREKRDKYKKMLDCIEALIMEADIFEEYNNRCLNLGLIYVQIRDKIEALNLKIAEA